MEFVYACNTGYAKQTIVSIASLLKIHPNSIIYVIAEDFSKDYIVDLAADSSIDLSNVEIINANIIFKDIEITMSSYHPRTIYAKLFLENIIDAHRVVYLDSDVIIADDISYLFDIDMTSEAAAGVLMPWSETQLKKHGLDKGKTYICDGIVVLNLDLWRKNRLGDKCRNMINEYNGIPPHQSEGVLNFVCDGMIKILPPEYNLMPSMIVLGEEGIRNIYHPLKTYNQADYDKAIERPRIVHFMTEIFNRPWFTPCTHPLSRLYTDTALELGSEFEPVKSNLPISSRVKSWVMHNLPARFYAWILHNNQK